ncbi:helix-turn-helix transcriptional regulator [Pseudomonas sp. MCal1]|uniref:LexA family transcriptional regulator n=1 Tax=Pseudomonas sp. MCal1 TaxID=2919887 RepID=UPI00225A47DB|nr:helix-turn-helix transcriptional regulator [Pseudomonas sp. MCal1]MCX4217989.1 helix-turn-helix transcriptional regulator [Pseudomonas sp. MCal1]
MNNSGQRLRAHLDEAGISYKDFAASIGVEPQHVNHWFKRGIPKGRIFTVADSLGVNPRWLADGGDGEPLEPKIFSNQTVEDAPHKLEELLPVYLEPLAPWDDDTPLEDDEVELKLYKEVELSSGHGRTAVQEIAGPKLRFSRHTMRLCGVDPSQAVFATNAGNSNHPLILHGATVGVDKGMTRIVDGEIYAIDHDGLLRVKFLERLPGGGLRMRSYNQPEFKDEDYGFDEIMEQRIVILGRVFWWSTIRPLRAAPLL